MPVNFIRLFQDSWNFIRNQRQFVLVVAGAFFLLSVTISLIDFALLEPVPVVTDPEQLNDPEIAVQILQSEGVKQRLLLFILNQLFFLYLTSWGILTVHHISRHTGSNLVRTLGLTLRRFPGVIVLNILIALPLLFSLANILPALMAQAAPSIFSVLVTFFAIYIFIRLCFAPVSYLVTEQRLSESLTLIWQAGIKRTTTLLLYCLIVYIAFQLIGQRLSSLADNSVSAIIVALIMAFISTFTLVFTYRFYTMFTQKA